SDSPRLGACRSGVGWRWVVLGVGGVADAELARAVATGMSKVNVSTHLNKQFTAAARTYLEAHPSAVDPRKYLGPARDAVAEAVTRLLGVLHGVHAL
ncbi:class II fructose-bisphosphate aldolase, partial [Streptomyces albogriseolus]|uniref:class II fructose-bisphosphate aldolase n=1 Tax=Streptomyces albogriseolus TaxID=1887 RepID=UPI0036825793